MLRSLVAQLSQQNREGADALDTLYFNCGSEASQPSSSMSMNTLQGLVNDFAEASFILDALGECKERGDLMTNGEEMVGWDIASLHMLITSRREKDIEDSFLCSSMMGIGFAYIADTV